MEANWSLCSHGASILVQEVEEVENKVRLGMRLPSIPGTSGITRLFVHRSSSSTCDINSQVVYCFIEDSSILSRTGLICKTNCDQGAVTELSLFHVFPYFLQVFSFSLAKISPRLYLPDVRCIPASEESNRTFYQTGPIPRRKLKLPNAPCCISCLAVSYISARCSKQGGRSSNTKSL